MNSRFVGSYPSVSKCPDDTLPEYAFIGRSNVGKSSLINFLLERRNIALVSSTPGKTQMINLIEIDQHWRIADLPGYGYAKLSKKHRESLRSMIEKYLLQRPTLMTTFVLIDSRVPPQDIDLNFIQFMGSNELPFTIVYTKYDKASQKRRDHIDDFRKNLLVSWETLPPEFITSSKIKSGRDDLLSYIVHLNTQLK